jgi:hypothetical protein
MRIVSHNSWLLCSVLLLGLGINDAFCQRADGGPKSSGTPAKVLYKQSFDQEQMIDSFQDATWIGDGAGAFGSNGAIKITAAQGKVGAERPMVWVNDETTICFLYYAHGVQTAYFQGKGKKANMNLHAFFPIAQQDTWQVARIKAGSMVQFHHGGVSTPGEEFSNAVFYVDEWKANVKDAYLLIDNIVIFSGEDGLSPSAPPRGVSAKWYPDAKAASINWSEAIDDVGVMVYEVHRSEVAGFQAEANTRLARLNDNYFEDKSVEAGKTYFYKIVAEDIGGHKIVSDEVKYISDSANVRSPAPASGK